MAVKKSKVVDKWKNKNWYTVLAPKMFENKEIAEAVANDELAMVNRVVSVSLMEVIGSGSQNAIFTLLRFRVTDVKGANANTKLIGYEIMPTYVKTFVRRSKSLLHVTVPIKSKEGESVLVKVIAVTGAKVSENTKKNLRNALVEEVKKTCEGVEYDSLMQDIVYGRLTSKLFTRLKVITPMKRVEVRKTELKENFK
jgi:small subunit ribosomal protein S3Ae